MAAPQRTHAPASSPWSSLRWPGNRVNRSREAIRRCRSRWAGAAGRTQPIRSASPKRRAASCLRARDAGGCTAAPFLAREGTGSRNDQATAIPTLSRAKRWQTPPRLSLSAVLRARARDQSLRANRRLGRTSNGILPLDDPPPVGRGTTRLVEILCGLGYAWVST